MGGGGISEEGDGKKSRMGERDRERGEKWVDKKKDGGLKKTRQRKERGKKKQTD